MSDLISKKALFKAWDGLSDEIKDSNLLIDEMIRRTQDAESAITGDTSDGYHTFNELYHHRALLFSVIVKAFPDKAWKAKLHHDGTMYDGMFIVGINTPEGQASYHYDIDPYWELFNCQELERAPEWDGHTPAQSIARIANLEPVRKGKWIGNAPFLCTSCKRRYPYITYYCPNCGARMDYDE